MSEQNYVISTPYHRKSTQLCDVNLLKLYFARTSKTSSTAAQPDVAQVHAAYAAYVTSPRGECLSGLLGSEEGLSAPDQALSFKKL